MPHEFTLIQSILFLDSDVRFLVSCTIWLDSFLIRDEVLVLATRQGPNHAGWKLFGVISHEVFVQLEAIVTFVSLLQLKEQVAFLLSLGELVFGKDLVEVYILLLDFTRFPIRVVF